jgi:hypothetical protein
MKTYLSKVTLILLVFCLAIGPNLAFAENEVEPPVFEFGYGHDHDHDHNHDPEGHISGATPISLGNIVVPSESPTDPFFFSTLSESDAPEALGEPLPGLENLPTLLSGSYDLSGESSMDETLRMDPLAFESNCDFYQKNGGFETNFDWYGSPATNVLYSKYYYQGARSLYMSTANRQNSYAWQPIAIPSQVSSIWVRLKAWQNMDHGETAWVSIWNANNTQRLWYEKITYTQGTWSDRYWWIDARLLAGQSVNFMFEMFHDGDSTYSQMWLDNVELGACDKPPAQEPAGRTIDLTFSLYRTITLAERTAFETMIKYASDTIYEMSNRQHKIGKVTFYQNFENRRNAHVEWYACFWPQAHLGGYARPTLEKIKMGDFHPRSKDYNPNVLCADGTNMLTAANLKYAGTTLAHEMGHYYYGLADEYPNPRYAGDRNVKHSIMSYHYCGISSQYCQQWYGLDTNYLLWLNFSDQVNFTTPNDQSRYYSSSGWDTLLRHPNFDSQTTFLNGKPRRSYYPELASVAPQPGKRSTIELPTNVHTPCSVAEACRAISFAWENPNLAPLTLTDTYLVNMFSPSGTSATYPQPALVIAQLSSAYNIARATVSTQVTAPDGTKITLSLRDDGIAPDYLANDGRYTGILPYNQNGSYTINTTFTNDNLQAAITYIGMEDVEQNLGNPVGEHFSASSSLVLQINGYTGDDHSDVFASATEMFTDNQPKRGQVDRAGDKDLFRLVVIGEGTYILRLSSFAFNMKPRIRVWDSTEKLLGEATIDPVPGYYYTFRLEGKIGDTLFIEISHTNSQSENGMYEISAGKALPGEEQMFTTFIPLIIR